MQRDGQRHRRLSVNPPYHHQKGAPGCWGGRFGVCRGGAGGASHAARPRARLRGLLCRPQQPLGAQGQPRRQSRLRQQQALGPYLPQGGRQAEPLLGLRRQPLRKAGPKAKIAPAAGQQPPGHKAQQHGQGQGRPHKGQQPEALPRKRRPAAAPKRQAHQGRQRQHCRRQPGGQNGQRNQPLAVHHKVGCAKAAVLGKSAGLLGR